MKTKQDLINNFLFEQQGQFHAPDAELLAKFCDYAFGWVSVEERLPANEDGENSIMCLVKTKWNSISICQYNQYHKCWDDESGDDHYSDSTGGEVTHWREIIQ